MCNSVIISYNEYFSLLVRELCFDADTFAPLHLCLSKVLNAGLFTRNRVFLQCENDTFT